MRGCEVAHDPTSFEPYTLFSHRAFEDRRPPKRWQANQQLLDCILRRILVRSIGRFAREAVISISFLFCVFGLAGIPLANASEPSWAGMWDTEWRGRATPAQSTSRRRFGSSIARPYANGGGPGDGGIPAEGGRLLVYRAPPCHPILRSPRIYEWSSSRRCLSS